MNAPRVLFLAPCCLFRQVRREKIPSRSKETDKLPQVSTSSHKSLPHRKS